MHRFSPVLFLLVFLAAGYGEVNVRDFGAAADGKTDDTLAIQKALDSTSSDRGGVVRLPKGVYLVAGDLQIPEGVTLAGEWEAPHHANTSQGTLVLATGGKGDENGTPLINLTQSSCIKGITILYPDQDPLNIHPYPWTIHGRGMHGSVIDVTLVNPYKGIDFGTHPNELHFISNVFGCPLRMGVFVDKTTDIGRIENVHFNPHAWGRCTYSSKAFEGGDGWKALCDYLEQNLEGFLIGQTDWEYMNNCFVIFPKIGLHFIQTERGAPNVVLTQCGSDIGPVAIQVDASQPHAGLAFNNCQIMSCIKTGPENKGTVKFTNCGFWPIQKTGSQAILEGQGTVIFSACHFAGWAQDGTDSPCIDIREGAALIQACEFIEEGKTQIRVGPDVDGVSIGNCRFRGGEKIEVAGEAVSRVEKTGNLGM